MLTHKKDKSLERYCEAALFRLPAIDERTVVVGRTGSGKTQFAMWLLSEANYDEMPWIIFDYKREKFFRDMVSAGHAKIIPLGTIPKEPGLYIVQPVQGRDDQDVENYFWALWEHENIGIMIDELYMIDPYSDSFQAILTQGRSKNIPMITLTQRPKKVSMFNFSESSHIILFHLARKKDRETAAENMPIDINVRLRDYESRWYDVNRDKLFHVQPAPGREIILERFRRRLEVPEGEKPERIVI